MLFITIYNFIDNYLLMGNNQIRNPACGCCNYEMQRVFPYKILGFLQGRIEAGPSCSGFLVLGPIPSDPFFFRLFFLISISRPSFFTKTMLS